MMQCRSSRTAPRIENLFGRPRNRRQFPPRTSCAPLCYAKQCNAAGLDAEIRMQEGYDHSYYFISTFLAEHVAWHASRLSK